MTSNRRRMISGLIGCLSIATALPLSAQKADPYPTKSIRYINPNPAGATSDIIARGFATELSRLLGQQVYVDNRGGAGSTVGSSEGAKAPPDGYTLTQTSSPLFSVVPHLYTKLNFDPVKDFRSIIVLVSFENVLVLHPSVPAKTLAEVMALAKAKPGSLTYGSSGNGTTTHLSGELFKQMAKLDISHVPYRGGAPAVTDLLGGQINMMFNNVPGSLPHIQSGALRAVAVTSAKRSPMLPDVPTVAEAGLSGYEAVGWFSMSVPAATPQPIVDKLSEASMKAVSSPAFVKLMQENGFTVVGGTPKQMDKMIQDEVRRWGPVVKAAGLRID